MMTKGSLIEEAESTSVDHGGVKRGAGVDDTILRLELTETDLQTKIFLEIQPDATCLFCNRFGCNSGSSNILVSKEHLKITQLYNRKSPRTLSKKIKGDFLE
jgi:hypothetical protein